MVTIFYIVYLFKHQKWSYCKTEQKFIIIVLLSIMMFNSMYHSFVFLPFLDPLFIGDWLGGNWFFSFINIFNISTFVAVLTLFVMVVTHSVVTVCNFLFKFITKNRNQKIEHYFGFICPNL